MPDSLQQALTQLPLWQKLTAGVDHHYVCLVHTDAELTSFFQALCAATEEVLGSDAAGPTLLRLHADVIFPALRPPTEQGKGTHPLLLVRKCWRAIKDLILEQPRTLCE